MICSDPWSLRTFIISRSIFVLRFDLRPRLESETLWQMLLLAVFQIRDKTPFSFPRLELFFFRWLTLSYGWFSTHSRISVLIPCILLRLQENISLYLIRKFLKARFCLSNTVDVSRILLHGPSTSNSIYSSTSKEWSLSFVGSVFVSIGRVSFSFF